MANDQNIKKFTAVDIEKYHQGLLSVKERHDLEKAALDDPFLADALEGYGVAGVQAVADLEDLKNRLEERTTGKKVVPLKKGGTSFPFLRVAAMIILLAGAGLLANRYVFNSPKKEIAEAGKEQASQVKAADSAILPSTPSVATNENPGQETLIKNEGNRESPVVDKKDKATTTPGTIQPSGENRTGPDKGISQENQSVAANTAPVTAIAPKNNDEVKDMVTASGRAADKKEDITAETKKKANDDNRINPAKSQAEENNNAIYTREDQKNARAVTADRKVAGQPYRNLSVNIFRGQVTDASNTGLPFANVTNTLDNVGTYTDANGYFTLTSSDSVLQVQVHSIGFENNNVALKNNVPSTRVVMQEDRGSLSEIVISNQKPNAAARSRNANISVMEPEPADGWEKYDSYLANNLKVPADFQRVNPKQNSVEVSFEVNKDGEPVNIRVEKSLCNSCDNEAIRLVREGPKWKKDANKKGRTTVTINF